ncbi:hypothetical protein [Streptomyces canus]|uniref:hypothetical protein n=1 Tax=Streptomyces canus TaxID=58343 RepID=UPI002E373574|nr:hypothetical protein [Streptomyces canus]
MTDALTSLVGRLAATAPGLRVETGPGPTGQYAYDASDYRVPPRAVAFPRSAQDVVAVLRAGRETGVPVTAQIDHLAGDRGNRALHRAELLDPAADQAARSGELS